MMILFSTLKFFQKNKTTLFSLFSLGLFSVLFLWSCASTASLKKSQGITDLKEKLLEKFESKEIEENELFRVLVSSESYSRRQLQKQEIFSFKQDESSDMAFSKELSLYDKINYSSQAIVKVSLYQDFGTLAKIRFVRSSGISEVDKIIAEDVTRWRFDFTTQEIPETFHISFYILLSNQVNKEQAKDELKKYIR